MEYEEKESPNIRKSFLLLEFFWLLFSLSGFLEIQRMNEVFMEKGEPFPFLHIVSPLFFILSITSIILIIYATFLKKDSEKLDLKEKMRNERYRYHIILLAILLVLTPISVLYGFQRTYEAFLSDTILMLFSSIFLPVIVFILAILSAGRNMVKTAKKHTISVFFLFVVIAIAFVDLHMIGPIFQPDVEFYRDSWGSIPDFDDMGNNTAMASLGVVNYGILPAKEIQIAESGRVVYNISVLEGGKVLKFNLPIECNYSCSHYDQNESDIYGPSCCETNLSLIYEGRTVDRITTIYSDRNTCTDVLLILSAPLALLIRKRKH